MLKFSTAMFALALGLTTASAYADDAQCTTVKLADPGWSDIASTNAIARLLLEELRKLIVRRRNKHKGGRSL